MPFDAKGNLATLKNQQHDEILYGSLIECGETPQFERRIDA